MQQLGHTRSVRRASYLIHTPDTFIRTGFPALQKAAAIIHVSPSMGASFTQYSIEFEEGGILRSTAYQRFIFVLDGTLRLSLGSETHELAKNGYAYIPQGMDHSFTSPFPSRATVIEKAYVPVADSNPLLPIVANETKIEGQSLMGDDGLQVRSLLPDTHAFDFAVNTMAYQPGAALSMVEVHIMEHGLLMLEGGGIYRVDDDWHPVTAGDFIWMASYCPQWFGALGKVPAKYLIYKDWNRHPLD